MYFEDIYSKIRPLWKESYSLNDIEITETYIKSLSKDWEDIDFLVDAKIENGEYGEWEGFMAFVMYQIITEYGIEQHKLGKETINTDDVPITRFENKYLENLQYEGNEDYLKEYEGLKKNTLH